MTAMAVALLLVVSGCGGTKRATSTSATTTAQPQWHPQPADNGLIAFVRANGVMIADERGEKQRAITPPSGPYGPLYDQPAWSTDGKQLAFDRIRFPTHAYEDVLVASARGARAKAEVVYRAGLPIGGHPAWAPDGRIVISSDEDVDEGDLLEASNISGRRFRLLPLPGYKSAREEGSGPSDEEAAWSPDGRLIAFTRNEGELYTVRPDGSALHRLPPVAGHNPDWSPDAKRILFDDGRDIWIAEADGTKAARLIAGPQRDFDPAWSPDGTKILFVRKAREATDVWVANADGSGLRMLIQDAESPDWQPVPRTE